jgi:hypothetical protein
MKTILCTLLLLLGSQCHAEDNFWKTSLNWAKQSLPQDTKISFNKSKIKFRGCKHREYEIAINKPISDTLTLEGGITYAKGRLNWGINNQKISLIRYSFVPRLQLNNRVSLGAGVVYQSSPEFRSSFGSSFDLPESQMLLVNSRFKGLREDHQVEIELSSHKWDATNPAGNWFERGAADNKLTVSYAAFF